MLLGNEAMSRVAQKRVILFGVGGVGSWCAESLVRSGFRNLTIVDFDPETVGQVKVEALRQRLLTINPAASITALQQTFTAETAESFHLDTYDYIIDAIDTLKDKALLILKATAATSAPATEGGEPRKPKFFSSMGAALKLDPTRIQVTEFWKVQGDPLARALRNRFKRDKLFPHHKFQCVYSDELITPSNEGKGSLVHITAIFGFTLAGLVLQDAIHS